MVGQGAWAAQVNLVGVHWGGPWVDGAKAITAKQDKYDVKWELHTGGAAAIMAKMKAAWPKPLYDLVAQFTPLYYAWAREGWPEPVTYEEMPNLRDIPEDVLTRNEKGEIIAIPFSHSSVFFGYRKDITPFPIKRMEDLLDPRLKGKVIVRDATQGVNNNTVCSPSRSAATSATWSRGGPSSRSSRSPATSDAWARPKSTSSTR